MTSRRLFYEILIIFRHYAIVEWLGNTPMRSVEVGTTTTNNSFLKLANEMAEQGDHNAAIPLYRRAHGWDTSSAAPLVGLGTSLSAIGQYVDAIDAYQKAIGNNGQNVAALKGLGSGYLALNRPTRALPFLQQAVRVNPRDVDAMACQKISELGTDCWVRPPEIAEGDIPEAEKDQNLADQFQYRKDLPPQPEDDA